MARTVLIFIGLCSRVERWGICVPPWINPVMVRVLGWDKRWDTPLIQAMCPILNRRTQIKVGHFLKNRMTVPPQIPVLERKVSRWDTQINIPARRTKIGHPKKRKLRSNKLSTCGTNPSHIRGSEQEPFFSIFGIVLEVFTDLSTRTHSNAKRDFNSRVSA